MTESIEIHPFAVYLIKTGQLLCSALGMKDKDLFTVQRFVNQLEPAVQDEEVIRALNAVELESAILIWSASHYVNQHNRHKQWSAPSQKFIMDTAYLLQKVQFWHLAEWIEATGRDTSQYWGLRRHQNSAVWVTREPTQQEKLQDGLQKLHEEFGVNIIDM